MFGLGQIHQSGANSTRIGSTWAPRREIWSPCRSVTRSGRPCAVDHTACTMFPRSNRPVENASWRRTESEAKPAAYAAIPATTRARGDGKRTFTGRAPAWLRGARSQQSLDEAARALAEHPLARLSLVRGAPARGELLAEHRVFGESPEGPGKRWRVSRRDEQGALPVDEQLARRRRVGGDERCRARERLERLVGDDTRGLGRRAEDSQRAACSLELLRQPLVLHPWSVLDVRWSPIEQRVELPAPDHTEPQLG